MSGPAAAPAGTVQWRLAGPPLLVRLLPIVAAGWFSVTGLLRLLDPDRQRTGSDVLLIVGFLLLLATLAAALVVTARTRVRVTDVGVEVREIGTRLYRWEEIRGVRLDSASRPRWPVLDLEDGRRRALPAPSGALRRPGDTTLADAVQLLLRRSSQHRPPGAA